MWFYFVVFIVLTFIAAAVVACMDSSSNQKIKDLTGFAFFVGASITYLVPISMGIYTYATKEKIILSEQVIQKDNLNCETDFSASTFEEYPNTTIRVEYTEPINLGADTVVNNTKYCDAKIKKSDFHEKGLYEVTFQYKYKHPFFEELSEEQTEYILYINPEEKTDYQ